MNLSEHTQGQTDPNHPSLEQLNAFAVGQLTEADSREVERHLTLCPVCNRLLESSPDDSFVALVQQGDSLELTMAPTAVASSRAFRFVPGYVLLEQLGEGGMGVVWKARHAGLNRVVALKRLRAAGAASAEALARFRREAEAVARLHHANIVQIYEVGEQEGEPYLALEYVGGGNLAQKLAAGPLPPRQAAALVELLARAMHHAHENGILHRDLKPSNILLASEVALAPRDSAPRRADATPLAEFIPKISDFGLAKQLDEATVQTQSGAILGTPSYMAPEQASCGQSAIGPAADVYALGAILYETLTGRPPFRGPSVLETLAQVREQEPVPPRQFQPSVPRDLQTICLKSLHKEPLRRFGSALELADDLRRFLAAEPIRARPVGTWERVWKWVRRRPTVAVLGLCTLVAAVALVAVGLIYQFRLQKALGRAESNAQKMLRAWDALIDVAEQNPLDVDEEELLRIFEKPRQAYEEMLRENPNDPSIRRRTAMLRLYMSGWECALGRFDQAKADCQQALDLIQQLVTEFPDENAYQSQRAGYTFGQAVILEAAGQRTKAVTTAEQARSYWKELPLDPIQDRIELAWTCTNLAVWSEDKEKARQLLHEALALVEDGDRGSSPSTGVALIRSAVYLNLGNLHVRQGGYVEAEADYQKALAQAKAGVGMAPRVTLAGPMNPFFILPRIYLNLASLRWGKPKEAEELYLQALQLRKQLAERHPHATLCRDELVLNHECLTAFYCSINRFSSAEEHLREAMKIRLQSASTAPLAPQSRIMLVREYGALAEILAVTGRRSIAEAECRKGLELLQPLAHDQPHYRFTNLVLAEVLAILGNIQIQNQKPQEAIASLTRAIALLEDLLRKTPDDNDIRTRLRDACRARAPVLKEQGELLRAVIDWLRSQILEQPPRTNGAK